MILRAVLHAKVAPASPKSDRRSRDIECRSPPAFSRAVDTSESRDYNFNSGVSFLTASRAVIREMPVKHLARAFSRSALLVPAAASANPQRSLPTPNSDAFVITTP